MVKERLQILIGKNIMVYPKLVDSCTKIEQCTHWPFILSAEKGRSPIIVQDTASCAKLQKNFAYSEDTIQNLQS